MSIIKEPKVNLLDYTGMGMLDPNWAAKKLIYTKRTRLEQSPETWKDTFDLSGKELEEELHYVANSVRSSWEFVDFTFQISNVGRGFTHQMVRTRTASYAQQSQRVVDMSGFDYVVPPCIDADEKALDKYSEVMSKIDDGYKALVDMGMPAQDARGVLPTNVGTSIICSMNLRTLADLCGKRDNPRAEGEYHKVFKGMAKCALEAMPWIEYFLYPPRMETPALDEILITLRGDRSPVENNLLNDAMKEIDRLKKVWG